MAKEMLFYTYPPNKKNIGYIVKCIKAIHFTDNRSILSIIKQTLLEVLTDSLVGEKYYSQFKGLFKTEFREKKWDL